MGESPQRQRPRMVGVVADSYTLDVLAIDVADAVEGAGGLMFDRQHEGWTVRVFVLHELDAEPLQILGVQGFPCDGSAASSFTAARPGTALALSGAAMADADLLGRDVWSRWRRQSAEVTVWGEPPEHLRDQMVVMEHRLSGAAHAFKAYAWAACARGPFTPGNERFHGTGLLCTPLNPDLVPITMATG